MYLKMSFPSHYAISVFYCIVHFLAFSFWQLMVDKVTLEIYQCQLESQPYTLSTDRQQRWHKVLLANLKKLFIQECSPCLHVGDAWCDEAPFANNGLLNPQLQGQPKFMMRCYYMSFLRLPHHVVSDSASRPQCPALHSTTFTKVKTLSRTKHLMSVFLQTSTLFHHSDADTWKTVKSSGILPTNECVWVCVSMLTKNNALELLNEAFYSNSAWQFFFAIKMCKACTLL